MMAIMETSSQIHDSSRFNSHSSNNIADTADVDELLLTENRFDEDNDFNFGDDEILASITFTADKLIINPNSHTENADEDEIEFEFPIDEQISPRLPLFDQTLLLDLNQNPDFNKINKPDTDSKSAPAPEARLCLRKLLIEARDSGSCSSSDSDELDGITPETYCVWNPNESHGKRKKSNSVSIGNSSKRWNVRDLLKRSYSDDSYCTGNVSPVLLFSPPVSAKPNVKGDSVVGAGAGVVSTKTVNKIPAYKGKIGNIRIPAYYPYRQDQTGVFGNFNGLNKNLYRH